MKKRPYIVRKNFVVKVGKEFHRPGTVLELTDEEAEFHGMKIEPHDPEIHAAGPVPDTEDDGEDDEPAVVLGGGAKKK